MAEFLQKVLHLRRFHLVWRDHLAKAENDLLPLVAEVDDLFELQVQEFVSDCGWVTQLEVLGEFEHFPRKADVADDWRRVEWVVLAFVVKDLSDGGDQLWLR